MSGLVVDTHLAIWLLQGDRRLSEGAHSAIEEVLARGEPLLVSTVTLVELAYLVEKRRIPVAAWEQLVALFEDADAGLVATPLTLEIAKTVARVPATDIPDMPDRIIAATALCHELPLVTRDHKIRTSRIRTIW